jgi:predicted nuclease of restriction endonuclease-like RecB superfamily
VLTKDLLRVSRRGGGYQPEFAERAQRPLAARVLGTYQGHVGEPRATLADALADVEADAEDFKLVRGFAKLVERDAVFETRAAVDPERARRAAFEAAEDVGVVTEADRDRALAAAADGLALAPEAVESALYADREDRQVLASVDARWGPDTLLAQYNLSLAQTALFDAVEVRVRSSDPKTLVSAVKRLGLLYEVHRTDDGREVVVTGVDGLFRRSRRYGTRFARLLRTVAKADEWHLTGTVDDRGTERTLALSHDDPMVVPDADPVATPEFDSQVEADFAGRFDSLDLDWDLVREPEPLATGTRVMIPDFAFDYRPAGAGDATPEFRVFFEIMGFWTPAYVEKKLSQLEDVEDVDLLVAVDESLGVGEEIEARDHRAIPYSGHVPVKPVRDALREYERDLVAESAATLPDEVVPEDDAVSLAALADCLGVSEAALEDKRFPEHRLVGRTLVRPGVLDALGDRVEPGMSLADVEAVLDEYGVDDASAALAALGYRVQWDGLSGGTVREREGD